MRSFVATCVALIGLEPNKTGHLEKWLSIAGGLLGMLAVVMISERFVDTQGTVWILASVGASAVLLFAVPHGPLSQPWPVVGGHVISATIGVGCAQLIPSLTLSASVAVALAIGAMYYLRCIHPPGGATALTAVVGGESIQALGFQYVVTPVLLNALAILAVAIVFNSLFPWRRYPAALAAHAAAKKTPPQPAKGDGESLTRADLEVALRAMRRGADDGSDYDVQELYHLATRHTQPASMDPDNFRVGQCYSNGLHGALWQIRRVTAITHSAETDTVHVAYRVVAGPNRRSSGVADAEAFAGWAKYEVFLNENSWQRVRYAESPP